MTRNRVHIATPLILAMILVGLIGCATTDQCETPVDYRAACCVPVTDTPAVIQDTDEVSLPANKVIVGPGCLRVRIVQFDGTPVRNASVMVAQLVSRGDRWELTTDESGACSTPPLQPGAKYSLGVRDPTRNKYSRPLDPDQTISEIVVHPGFARRVLTLTLRSASSWPADIITVSPGTLSGRFLHSDRKTPFQAGEKYSVLAMPEKRVLCSGSLGRGGRLSRR